MGKLIEEARYTLGHWFWDGEMGRSEETRVFVCFLYGTLGLEGAIRFSAYMVFWHV